MSDGRPCHFCGRPMPLTDVSHGTVVGGWLVTCTAPLPPGLALPTPRDEGYGASQSVPYLGVAPLCARHEQVLREAGETGRVYGPTGARWWIGAARRWLGVPAEEA